MVHGNPVCPATLPLFFRRAMTRNPFIFLWTSAIVQPIQEGIVPTLLYA